jgi:hypothetical protein
LPLNLLFKPLKNIIFFRTKKTLPLCQKFNLPFQ